MPAKRGADRVHQNAKRAEVDADRVLSVYCKRWTDGSAAVMGF